MRKKARKNIVKVKLVTIAVLAIALFLLQLLEGHPNAIERYYSEGVYLWICRVLHPVFNLLPFSLGDIIYLVIIALIIYAFIKLIRLLFKKQFNPALVLFLTVIIWVQGASLAFYLLWGLNYYRPSAAERLKLTDTSYTTPQLVKLTTEFIDSANATRARVTPADLAQPNDTIFKIGIAAVNKLSDSSTAFRTYYPKIKPSLFTHVINYMGTSGYYNPFTTESQMNYQMPVFLRPFVVCHELSHQMGYGPEDEANFVSFLAAVKSNNRLLRYSAYHEAVDEFMHDLYMRDSVQQKQLKLRVSPAVHQDFVAERKYWMAYAGPTDMISSFFYNGFLKANNQPQGLLTYNRMILLVIAWHRKNFH
jgi:hypothetical protein